MLWPLYHLPPEIEDAIRYVLTPKGENFRRKVLSGQYFSRFSIPNHLVWVRPFIMAQAQEDDYPTLRWLLTAYEMAPRDDEKYYLAIRILEFLSTPHMPVEISVDEPSQHGLQWWNQASLRIAGFSTEEVEALCWHGAIIMLFLARQHDERFLGFTRNLANLILRPKSSDVEQEIFLNMFSILIGWNPPGVSNNELKAVVSALLDRFAPKPPGQFNQFLPNPPGIVVQSIRHYLDRPHQP